MSRQVEPAGRLNGTVTIPGDKSISHRVLMFGALAHGETQARNLAPGADVRSTASVLRSLGVVVDITGDEARIMGHGPAGLKAPSAPLDCGNSGTTMRLMMGILAGTGFESTLIGDASLSGRPMERVATPLREMGAQIHLNGGKPPVRIAGQRLRGTRYTSPIASAQVKSAILLAGLWAPGETRVIEPGPSRDHTERLLRQMGATVDTRAVEGGIEVALHPAQLRALGRVQVPGDLSSAAFLLAAGALLADDGIRLVGVGMNPTRTGILDALEAMGATVTQTNLRHAAGEPVCDLEVSRSALRGATLSGDLVVRAIDEVPILAVLATQATGRTVITDAAELRVKESDRLAAVATMLTAMGATVTEQPDGLIIDGPTPLNGARVDAVHDHRIAMAAAVAGLVASSPTTIDGADVVDVSYPGFFDVLDGLR